MNDNHATFLKVIIARPDDDGPRLYFADFLEGTAGMVPCSQCVGGWIGCVFRDADGERSRTSKAKCNACHGTGEVSNGHAERAEFIRVQIELATIPQSVYAYGRCKVTNDHPYPSHPRRCGSCEPCKNWQAAGIRSDALRRRERALIGENVSREPGRVKPRYYEWCEQASIDPMWVLTPGFNIGLEQRAVDHFRRGFIESLTCSWSDFRQHAAAIMAATPLRRVRLTTWPDDALYEPFAAQFPGIEFELPQRIGGIPA